ncbi:MAG TPA: tripartite tricarboxylate transporter TctB family protein [Burkholderiaceae bacterium]|nr:tripartite tricarboxylate transporter TctB family protein [Burkholderiaceae bacterium]
MSRRADLISAAVWGAFGAVVIVASWQLPRLEQMGINPWSVPGLTPGLIGAAIVLLAAALALRAMRSAAPSAASSTDAPDDAATPASLRRSGLAALLCLAFAGISLGHGLPFALEATLFVFVFVCVFSWRVWRAEGRWVRGVLSTLLIAVLSSAFIAWLFSAVFLVRLP